MLIRSEEVRLRLSCCETGLGNRMCVDFKKPRISQLYSQIECLEWDAVQYSCRHVRFENVGSQETPHQSLQH